MSLKEIGKKFDRSEVWASNKRREALKIIKDSGYITTDLRLTEYQKGKDVLDARNANKYKDNMQKPVEILPEYVVDFEIDNESSLEEEFVLERDWDWDA